MKLKELLYAASIPVLAFCTAGCDNALNPVLENAFYISEASSSNVSKVILNETLGGEVTATVRCADKLENDVQVKLSLSQEALDDYNRRNGTALVILPEQAHDFRESVITVKAGQSLADRVTVHVKPYTDEMKESGVKYALPITIAEVSDGTPALEVKKTMIYTFEQVIITYGLQINAMSGVSRVLNNKIAGNAYTIEMRVAPRGQDKENEAFFMIYPDQDPINENYGQIYCRFQVDNSLNIKVLSNEGYTCAGPFGKKWHHVALVCTGDGTLITYVNGTEAVRESKPLFANVNHLEKVTIGSASQIWHTYPYCYSEIRIWSAARSQSQIADNMFSTAPQSDNLVAYWKCNEGSGTVLHDATGNGNDIDLATSVETHLTDGLQAWQWIGPVRTDTDQLPE